VLGEQLLQKVARTSAVSLVSQLATHDMITSDFELLGKFDYSRPDDARQELDVWYRHLREDMGTTVWAHPDMLDFLQGKYDDLVLMRNIREIDGKSETLPDRSVFSTQLRPGLGEATLSPMVVGSDVAEVVANHVAVLQQEDYRNIFFYLDLAYGWQAATARVLMDNGFVPQLVLPYAGKSDVVVFQHV